MDVDVTLQMELAMRKMIRSLGVFAAFAGFHVSLAQPVTPTSAGYTPGTFDVSSTGQATYSIPLWTPPGTNSVEPKLALSYSSNNRASGWISPGWALAGLSQIARCQKTIEYDGQITPVYLNLDDAYCLDGQRLETHTGAYGYPDSTYRTKLEQYSLVTAKEVAGNGPAWFEVRTNDGLIYEYGRTGNSRALLPGGTTPYLWSLSKIRDRQGNNLIIDYVSSSGALLPNNIQYTQSPALAATYPYTVVFNYASRDADDTLTGYVAGSQFSINRRLASIDVRYGGTTGALLRQHRLSYTDSPTTQRARLSAVQECAGASGTDCLAATTIGYQDGQAGVAVPGLPVGSLPNYNQLRVADINDDGRSDLIFSAGPTNGYFEWFVSLASPAGYGAPMSTGVRLSANDFTSELLVGDFLGIGRVQLIAPGSNDDLWCMWYWGDDGLPLTQCSTNKVDRPLTPAGLGPDYAAADINGDGRADLVWGGDINNAKWIQARLSISVAGQLSFGAATAIYPVPENFAGIYGSYGPASAATATDRLDFNGDTRDDLVLVTGSQTGPIMYTARQLLATHNTFFATGPTLTNYAGVPRGVQWNDDACTDLQFSSMIYLSACNGTAGQAISAPQGSVYLDWNGDGRTDLLYRSGTMWALRLSQGAGVSAELSTGIPFSTIVNLVPLDYDADGLVDLMTWHSQTRALTLGLHAGVGTPADLMAWVVDGNGNRVSLTYKPITIANYAPGSNLPYPTVTRKTPLYVVDQFTASDGTGGTYANQFFYWGARWNTRGLGFLGFETKRTFDTRTGLFHYEFYSQEYPTIGWLKGERTVQSNDSTPVQTVQNTLASMALPANETLFRFTHFAYVQRSIIRNYEVGGARNGQLISTRDIAYSYDNWGTMLSQNITTTEGATGLYDGAVYTEAVTASEVGNDLTSWCLNKPRRVKHTRRSSLPTGTEVARTTQYSWDFATCRLTQQIVEPDSAQWAVTTDYGYDDVGNVDEVKVTPAVGQGQAVRTSLINWGTDGRFPRTVTNAKNQVTTFGWDPGRGVRTTVTDPNNLITTTAFDNFNRTTRQSYPDGTATDVSYQICSASFVWCAAADVRTFQQVTTRDTANAIVRTDVRSFDSMDRPRYTYRQLLSGAMSGEIKTYNSRGLVSASSMPFIQGEPIWYTTFGYDALGRTSTIQRPISEGNAGDHLTRISYDGLSSVQIDALNRSTTRYVNALGEIVRVVDADDGATNYEYDAFGNMLTARDAAGNQWSNAYNVRGMKERSTDPDAGTWTYTYYPLGEMRTQTDAKNQVTTFTFDVLSRLLTRVDGDGTTEFTYDTMAKGVGQRATATSPGGYSEAYSYDAFGRLSQTRITADASNYQYDYGYNATTGLLQYLTYPTSSSGFRFKVRYDYAYGLVQKVSNFSGDVVGEAYWEGIATNARGQHIDEQYGNGLRTISGYDRIAGWLDDRTTGRSGATSLQNFTYKWDAIGNLSERRDVYNNTTENFHYDDLDRLDRSTLNGTTNLVVGYDAIGNITSKTGVGTYTYHATKRHAVVSTTGTINNAYAYDANGNMETRNGQPITWYRNNLPRKISASATVSNEFWYGPDGARWKQVTVNGSSTGTWTYIGAYVERLVTSTVNEYRHYVHGPNGVVAVYKRPASGVAPTTTYVTKDHLGSLDVITSTAGFELADAAFSAFGERVNFTGSGPPNPSDLTALKNATRRGFTFQEHLDETGLIHMNGRVYDPVIARFISPDPFVQAPFNGQSLNPYSYALNNPLKYTDPSGFNWDDDDDVLPGIPSYPLPPGPIRPQPNPGTTPRESPHCMSFRAYCGLDLGDDPLPPRDYTPVTPVNPVLPREDNALAGVGQSTNGVNAPPRLVIGFRGAGIGWLGLEGDTPSLTAYVENLGGSMYEHGPIARWRAVRAAKEFIKNNPNGEIVLTGYSRGGRSAFVVANRLGEDGIAVRALVTFDPHDLNDDVLRLEHDNVANGVNFYQQNPKTWLGGNPFTGRPVASHMVGSPNHRRFTPRVIRGHDYTGEPRVGHLNIVGVSLVRYEDVINEAVGH